MLWHKRIVTKTSITRVTRFACIFTKSKLIEYRSGILRVTREPFKPEDQPSLYINKIYLDSKQEGPEGPGTLT